MPSPVRIGDFIRMFERFGVQVEVKGSHVKMRKIVAGQTVHYVAVVHGNHVEALYVRKARKTFRLLDDDGVSDKEFGL